ncbi:MAG: NnrU family protein [Pseudomonadota bacterium]
MALLIAGLVVFLGLHLLPAFSGVRAGLVQRLGEGPYKGLFSISSAIGLVMIIYGYGAARADGSPVIWDPPTFLRHLSMLLMLPVFVFFLATYFPGRIKAALKHPTLVAVKAWALAHFLANGDLAGMLLFGGFLAWAVFDRISLKRRAEGSHEPEVSGPALRNDAIAVGAGLGIYALVAFQLHPILFGVPVVG